MIDRHTKHDLIPYKPAYDQVFNSFDEAWTYAQEAEIPLRGQTYIVYYKDNAIDSDNVHCIIALCNANKNDEHLFLSDMSYHELRESSKDPEGEMVNKPFPVAVRELNDLILKLSETGGGAGTVVSWEQLYNEGEHIATININGESIYVYAPLSGDNSWKHGIAVTSDGKVFIKGIGGFSGNNENESSSLQDILIEIGMATGIDVTLPITYVIKFVDYDGTILKQSNILKNTMPTEPEAPTRPGYTFIGWDHIIEPAIANTTYTAQYEKISMDVTFVGTDFEIPTTKDDILLSSNDMVYDSNTQSLKASSSNKTFTLQAKNDVNIISLEITTNSTNIRYQTSGITDENGNVIASSCVRDGNKYTIILISPATTVNCKNNGGGVSITQIVVVCSIDPVGPTSNEIWYTTTDSKIYPLSGIIETLVSSGAIYNGPAVVSNEYDEEKQIWRMTFDSDVTVLGDIDVETMTVAGPFFATNLEYGVACNVKTIILPKTVTRIGGFAFYGCAGLTSIGISDSVRSIGQYAFSRCMGLTSIDISDSVSSIGGDAFNNCSGLKSVTIGSGVISIGEDAFYDCIALTSITCKATTPPTLTGYSVFDNTNNCPIYVHANAVDTYKSATSWSNYASRIHAIQSNPVSVTIDGGRISVNSKLSWLDNGYSTLYTQSTYDPGYDEQPEDFEIDTSSMYPNEGDVYYTTCVNEWEE